MVRELTVGQRSALTTVRVLSNRHGDEHGREVRDHLTALECLELIAYDEATGWAVTDVGLVELEPLE